VHSTAESVLEFGLLGPPVDLGSYPVHDIRTLERHAGSEYAAALQDHYTAIMRRKARLEAELLDVLRELHDLPPAPRPDGKPQPTSVGLHALGETEADLAARNKLSRWQADRRLSDGALLQRLPKIFDLVRGGDLDEHRALAIARKMNELLDPTDDPDADLRR
jgi:hypothetical protein